MPEKVRQIDEKVDRMERKFDRLLSMAGGLDDAERSESGAEGQRSMKDYVS